MDESKDGVESQQEVGRQRWESSGVENRRNVLVEHEGCRRWDDGGTEVSVNRQVRSFRVKKVDKLIKNYVFDAADASVCSTTVGPYNIEYLD